MGFGCEFLKKLVKVISCFAKFPSNFATFRTNFNFVFRENFAKLKENFEKHKTENFAKFSRTHENLNFCSHPIQGTTTAWWSRPLLLE